MKKSILIRVDGSFEIGLGHVIRCIALADMLRDNFSISFNSMKIPNQFIDLCRSKGYSFKKLYSDQHFLSLLIGDEIVVLDNYELGTEFQKEVKKTGCKLVCIDDLHDQEFYADLIINHLPGAQPQDYRAQEYTNYALGMDYALLRSPFLRNKKKEKKITSFDSVFICFGGSDIKNLTLKVLGVIKSFSQFMEIKVVVGHAYNYIDTLEESTISDNRISLYRDLDDHEILDLMNQSDLAVVPASGILYEVVSSNTPVITGKYVDNQKYFLEQFSRLPSVKSAGNFEESLVIKAINEFLSMENLQSKNYIDGKSSERLRMKFDSLG